MPGHHCRHPRRAFRPHHLVFLVTFSILLLAPVLDSVAQGTQLQARSTATTGPDDPQLGIEPTVTPTPRATEEPAEIDDLQAEPTAVPTDPPQPAAPSSLTINKGACDDSTFDPATAPGLQAFLDACQAVDGEFEFTVSNGGDFSVTAFTELGTFFTQLPTGPVTITETIPGGWGEPAVFCWSNLVPTPSDTPFIGNGPTWDVQEGEDVECWWFNVSEAVPGDLTSPTQGTANLQIYLWECPAGFVLDSLASAQLACTTPLDGVTFDLDAADPGETDLQAVTGTGAPGFATFDDIPSGTWAMDEQVPAGYTDPAILYCDDLYDPAATGPLLQGTSYYEIDLQPGDYYECHWINVLDNDNHTIQLIKVACPEGTDPNSDRFSLQEQCATPMEGVGFSLTTDGGMQSDVTAANGRIQWTNVDLGATGQVTLDEDVPEGYGDPVVWCVSFPVAAADPEDFDYVQVTASDGAVTVAPEQHEPFIFECVFYNFVGSDGAPGDLGDPGSMENGEGATVTVVKHRCPLGVPEDATRDQYVVICTESFGGVGFTLDHAGGSFPGETGDDGEVEWPGVPAGEIELQEDVPSGFKDPLAFCTTFDGEQDLASWQADAGGGLVEIEIPDNATAAVCWVFNIPDPEVATSLTVNKWRCPAGFDEDAQDPETHCTAPMDGVTFTLGDLEATTGDLSEGQAIFHDVPPGDHGLTEVLPNGIERAFAGGCTVNGEAVALLVPLTDPPMLEVAIEPGEHWTCEWYNVPPVESRVLINKRICPAEADLLLTDDNTINDIITACPTEGDGIAFTLDSALGSSTQEVAGGATWWDGVPNGPITITEHLPAGYLEPVWYCGTNPFDAAGDLTGLQVWELFVAPGGVLDETLDEDYGEIFACWVFNVPGDDNDIDIHKWLCPEGFDPFVADSDYFEQCTEALDGIAFKAMSDLGIAVLDTVGGQVGFGGFPAGMHVGIQEEIPAAYGNPYVICRINDEGDWIDMGASTGYFEYTFAGAGDTLVCHVFNFQGEPGDLTILKWTCPPGYDLHAAGADPSTDCTEATNGIPFQFGPDDGLEAEAVLQVTGDVIDGGVFFDGLAPGAYKVVEQVPEGIASVFVLECTGHIMGVLQSYPLSEGNVFEIDIDAGEHLTCHWFNVPQEDGGKLTLIKYTCSTETFVSEVDCEIEEDGKTFDLSYWSGTWDLVDTDTTDGFGRIQWTGLADGEYWFGEHDGEWCHIASDDLYADGPWVIVLDGQETVVHVYNCDGTPGKPGDTPTKYPNTGIPPEAAAPVELWQQGGGDGSSKGFLGPLGGIIGIAFLAWRVVDIARRTSRQREERKEQEWQEARASVTSGYLTTRAERMCEDTASKGYLTPRAERLAGTGDDTPGSRPDRNPG